MDRQPHDESPHKLRRRALIQTRLKQHHPTHASGIRVRADLPGRKKEQHQKTRRNALANILGMQAFWLRNWFERRHVSTGAAAPELHQKPDTRRTPLPSPTSTPAPVQEATPVPAPTREPISIDPRVVKGVPQSIANLFIQIGEETGVPSKILSAIAKHESAGTFKKDLKQYGFGKGRGMMQIDLGVHSDISEEQAFDPEFSIRFAADHLLRDHTLYDEDPSNWDNAIRAYNAGWKYNSDEPGYNKMPIKQLANQYLEKVKSHLNDKS